MKKFGLFTLLGVPGTPTPIQYTEFIRVLDGKAEMIRPFPEGEVGLPEKAWERISTAKGKSIPAAQRNRTWVNMITGSADRFTYSVPDDVEICTESDLQEILSTTST